MLHKPPGSRAVPSRAWSTFFAIERLESGVSTVARGICSDVGVSTSPLAVPIWCWVHGHSGVLQSPYGFLIERLGYCLRLKADNDAEAWLHYSVPVVSLPGSASASEVAVRYRTWAGGRLDGVHIWDGGNQIGAFEDLDESSQVGRPTNLEKKDAPEQFHTFSRTLPDNQLRGGIGVSLLVAGRACFDAIAIVSVGVSVSSG